MLASFYCTLTVPRGPGLLEPELHPQPLSRYPGIGVLPQWSQACFQDLYPLHPMSVPLSSGNTLLCAPQGPEVALCWAWMGHRHWEGFTCISSRPSQWRTKAWSWCHGRVASSPQVSSSGSRRALGSQRTLKNPGLILMKVYFIKVGGLKIFYQFQPDI